MSILIKGMDMPNDCCQCKLARYDDYENETFCPFTDVMCLSIGRQDNCPLEELPETHDKRTETHACDLIERQDAIRIVDGIDTWQAGWRGNAIESLKAMPSAQPEPSMEECACCVLSKPERKKGRWIEHNPHKWGLGIVFECSECGEKIDCEPSNFCPNCGEEMRGEE